MDNLIIKCNNQVDENLLDKVLEFDRTLFPTSDDYSFPDDYIKNLYRNSKDGMFVLLDNDIVVGYVNAIFLSDEKFKSYLNDRDYLTLENIGLHVGDNNMYFYTVALKEEYRKTNALKVLMTSFTTWLENEILNGKRIKNCISEVVTDDGIKMAYFMGMIPSDIDESGYGIYYSPDCLANYIKIMKQEKIKPEKINLM